MLNFGGVSATQNSASKEQHSRRESPAGLPGTSLDRPRNKRHPKRHHVLNGGFQYLQKWSLLSDVKRCQMRFFF